jgi:hypothetical protein
MKTPFIGFAIAAIVSGAAHADLLSVDREISTGSTLVKQEASYDVMTPKDRSTLEAVRSAQRELQECELLPGCHGGGTGPDFVAKLQGLIARLKEACGGGGVKGEHISPKPRSTTDFYVSTSLSKTEVTGVTESTPLVIKKVVIAPIEILSGIIEMVTVKCSQTNPKGVPDVNSIHSYEVCHSTPDNPNGTCYNASPAQP